MDINTQKIRELLDQRDAIDAQIAEMFTGTTKVRKEQRCGTCGETGHQSRTCSKKE